MGRLLTKNKFLIGLSLDGPRPFHDAYRVDKGGQRTFDRVLAALALLRKHLVNFNILCCVHSANAPHPLRVYRFLRDEVGARFIQFIPIVETESQRCRHAEVLVSPRSVTGKQFGQFLVAVFDEWVKRDVGTVVVHMFEASLAAWLGESLGLCVFEPTCGQGWPWSTAAMSMRATTLWIRFIAWAIWRRHHSLTLSFHLSRFVSGRANATRCLTSVAFAPCALPVTADAPRTGFSDQQEASSG